MSAAAKPESRVLSPPTADRFLGLGLSRETAARYVGVSPGTFDAMVRDGRMPKPRCINARRVWDRREVEAAFEAIPKDDDDDEPNPWDGA